MTSLRHRRAGITLLEVLISIGVLTIGLVSVLSLVPAGRSYAVKATIYDRATSVAENAIADVITRGYLDPVRFALSTAKPTRIDHLGLATGTPLGGASFDSIASSTGWAVAANAAPVCFAVCSSSDDLVFVIPTNDGPPSPGRTAGGLPVAENKFSWVATLMGPAGAAIPTAASGAPAVLSVVVFHRRDLSGTGQRSYAGSASGTTVALTNVTAANDKEFLRSGGVVLIGDGSVYTWRRVLLAAFDDASQSVALTVEGRDLPSAVTVYAFTGAVGLAERLVHLESPSPWSLP